MLKAIIFALAIASLTMGGQYARAACHPHPRFRHHKSIRLQRNEEHSVRATQNSEVESAPILGAGEIDDNGGVHPEGQGLSIP